MGNTFVSIVMPALNEALHIEAAIKSLRPKNIEYEILVLDGGSNDATCEIVYRLMKEDSRIRLLHNPARRQAAAMNLAAREANPRAQIILRADCHCLYPPNFVEECLSSLKVEQCASVVVPMQTIGTSCLQQAIAAAQNSRMGNGGAHHRIGGKSGYVEHGHHAAFDREIFLSVGGYCEKMAANEDAELDVRLRNAGHRIWMCSEACITYFPRSTIPSLARQYFGYGVGRAMTCLTHRIIPKPRQFAPALIVVLIALSIPLSSINAWALMPTAAYVTACMAYGCGLGISRRSACATLSGIPAMVMHLAWGAGFLTHLAKSLGSAAYSPSADTSGISRTR